MSFRRVHRRLIDQPKPAPVERDGIVLQWKDDAPSPCLQICIGHDLAAAMGWKSFQERAQFLIGEAGDAGKCAIRSADVLDGDIRVQPYRYGFRVHLPCHISIENFTFCKRTVIDPRAIELRDGMLIFSYEGIKQ